MNRKEILNDLYNAVESKFEEFKEKVVDNNMEDYCDEMALMYAFRKFIQFLENDKMLTDEELQEINKYGSVDFIENFMEVFWGSQLGNSYEDIAKLIRETLKEIGGNK